MKLKRDDIYGTYRLSQAERLRQEFAEIRRYNNYGDECDSNYCTECPYYKTEQCYKNCMQYITDYKNN